MAQNYFARSGSLLLCVQQREARVAKNLSQRDLSKLAGVPQSHISKIESNQVDLRLSSLIALANALDLEVALVPRQAMPAVRSISRQATVAAATKKMATRQNRHVGVSTSQDSSAQVQPAYTLDEDDD